MMLKILKNYFLILLSALVLISCGESKKKSSDDSTNIESESIIDVDSSEIIYELKGDCKSFIEGIDFSSLCFTEKQHPEYKDGLSAVGRCQFQFSDDKIRIVVIHKDYANYDAEKIEMDKLITQGAFQKTGKRLYAKTKQIDNLGDDAYIGYENISGGNDTKLAIILSNVSVSIDVENESCLSSDDQLLKLGQLILARIKA